MRTNLCKHVHTLEVNEMIKPGPTPSTPEPAKNNMTELLNFLRQKASRQDSFHLCSMHCILL
jgi:hypothetical protein